MCVWCDVNLCPAAAAPTLACLGLNSRWELILSGMGVVELGRKAGRWRSSAPYSSLLHRISVGHARAEIEHFLGMVLAGWLAWSQRNGDDARDDS